MENDGQRRRTPQHQQHEGDQVQERGYQRHVQEARAVRCAVIVRTCDFACEMHVMVRTCDYACEMHVMVRTCACTRGGAIVALSNAERQVRCTWTA